MSLSSNTYTNNPILALYAENETAVAETRRALLAEIATLNPGSLQAVDELLRRRRKDSPLPLMGELLPHFLFNFASLSRSLVHDIAVGWLALYLSAASLDDTVDGDRTDQPSSTAVLTPYVLFIIAQRKMAPIVSNTPFEHRFYDELLIALEHEGRDANLQRHLGNLKLKEEASRLKNSGLRALAAVISAACMRNNQPETHFDSLIQPLMLAFQALDDLMDMDIDLQQGRFSHVVDILVEGDAPRSLVPDEIYWSALKSGNLEKLLFTIRQAIGDAIVKVEGSKSASFLYLTALLDSVDELHDWCSEQKAAGIQEPEVFLNGLRQRMLIVQATS